jgi:hypothetical protein
MVWVMKMARKNRLRAVTAAWLMSAVPATAAAQGARDWTGVAATALTFSTQSAGLSLDARLVAPSGVQLGVLLGGQALSVGYFAGYEGEGLLAGDAALVALLPLLVSDPVELDLRWSSGARYLRDVGAVAGPHRSALRATNELSFLAHVRLQRRWLLRAGGILGVELELEPAVDVADQAQLVTIGLGHALGREVLVYGNVDAGGTYGFNGDNGKVVLRGALGLRVALGGSALTVF